MTATQVAPLPDSALAEAIGSFCRERGNAPRPGLREALPSSALWAAVADTGTRLWLDTGDVDAIRSLWTREFTALTTNNTLLNKEVQKGIYDALVPELARLVKQTMPGAGDDLVVWEIAFALNALHGLKLVETFDADVSVELHTDLAHDAEASYRYGTRFAAICPERFIVKVPLTPEGILAARRLSDDGVRLNFTLGFSARQNWLIALAARPTWVNVFMGRLNSFVKDRGLGDGDGIGEKATLSSQRLLRRVNVEHGLSVRQIGASIRSGQQVFDLAGLDVLTIPTGAAAQFVELGVEPAQVTDHTADDPAVSFHDGMSAEELGLDVLWASEGPIADAMAALVQVDVGTMTGDALRTFLVEHSVPGLFPKLSDEELAAIRKDGKIPTWERWEDRVRDGTADWDGVFTESALQSFASDQAEFDQRVRGLI